MATTTQGPTAIWPPSLKHLQRTKPNWKSWSLQQIKLFNITELNNELPQFELIKCTEVGCFGRLIQDKSFSKHVKRKHGIITFSVKLVFLLLFF